MGSTLERGRLPAVPMASVGKGTVAGAAGGFQGARRGFLAGKWPWIAFLWAKGGASPTQQTGRPSAFDRARALDSGWETAAGTQDERCGGLGARRGAALPCPGAWLEENAFSFERLTAGKAMTSWTSAVSSCPLVPPRCPRASGSGPHHTTALFTSTPLLLCEDVMGYSATLVPFSSFLRGFLGAGGGAGEGHG